MTFNIRALWVIMAFHISTEERLFFTAECFYYCGNVILENYFY